MFRTVALRCGVFVLKCKYIFNSYFRNNTQIDITSLTSLSVLTFAHTFLGLTGPYWSLLGFILGLTGPFWTLLGLTGSYLALLGLIWPYLALGLT